MNYNNHNSDFKKHKSNDYSKKSKPSKAESEAINRKLRGSKKINTYDFEDED